MSQDQAQSSLQNEGNPSYHPLHSPQGETPKPTSGRENNRVTYWFVGVVLVVLSLVLGFNFLGPEGATRTGVADGPAATSSGQITGGPSTDPAGMQRAPQARTTSSAPDSPNSRTSAAPQAPDSATPPGREGVGAQVGSQASPAPQERIGAGGTSGSVPPAAISPASTTPAAPPASR